MKRRIASAVSVGLMMITVGAGLTAWPAQAKSIQSTAVACPTVTFLGVRGSGEHSGFGTTVSSVLQEFTSYTALIAPGATISAVTIEYPAVDVLYGGVTYISQYVNSVNKGDAKLAAKIRSIEASSCGVSAPPGTGTRIVLVGYSQGAQVVGDTYVYRLSAQEQSFLSGVFLVADPRFQGSDSDHDWGTYNPKYNGLVRDFPAYHAFRTWPVLPAVFSVCMAKDPICNLTVTALASCKLHSASCPHLHYADRVNTNWGETYTKFLGDEITIVLFGTCPPIAGKRTPAAVGGLSAPDAIAKGC